MNADLAGREFWPRSSKINTDKDSYAPAARTFVWVC